MTQTGGLGGWGWGGRQLEEKHKSLLSFGFNYKTGFLSSAWDFPQCSGLITE